MKTMIRFAGCFLLLVLCLSGCGKDENEPINPTATVTVAPTETPSPIPTATPAITPNDTSENDDEIEDGELPSLKEYYRDYFSFGVGVTRMDILQLLKAETIQYHFNSLTLGNEMKADSVLDREATLYAGTETCPVINMKAADTILAFAQENNIPVRGHTLVWHSQVPAWFFNVGYSNAANAELVSREVMLARMENYIKLVMEYTNTTYPGLIYAWDVVNEAIDTGGGHKDGLRTESLWFQTIGEDYVEKAFEFARKYQAEGQSLFYNDFNTYETIKRTHIINLCNALKEKGLIDGIGLQSHLSLSSPSGDQFETNLIEYGKTGLQVQLTELDVDTQSNDEETQQELAKRYKKLFVYITSVMDRELANITNVTIWGLTDTDSWLNDETPSWPLLFTQLLEPKPAFWGVLKDPSIKLY